MFKLCKLAVAKIINKPILSGKGTENCGPFTSPLNIISKKMSKKDIKCKQKFHVYSMFILLLFDKFGAIQEVGKKGREKKFFVDL